ncbi:MAG: hypothetical protein DRP19_04725, partial [Thermotogae bacterium]
MKKGLILALVALIVVPALAVMASTGLTVWELKGYDENGNEIWNEIFDPGDPDNYLDAKARAYKSGEAH